MRTFVKVGALSAALAGMLALGGCASVGSVGPAADHNPTRMNYLYSVSGQLNQIQTRVQAIQNRLDELGGQTRTHLADQLASVRLEIFAAQRDLGELRSADNGVQWKKDRGHLKTKLDQMTHSLDAVDQAMKKA